MINTTANMMQEQHDLVVEALKKNDEERTRAVFPEKKKLKKKKHHHQQQQPDVVCNATRLRNLWKSESNLFTQEEQVVQQENDAFSLDNLNDSRAATKRGTTRNTNVKNCERQGANRRAKSVDKVSKKKKKEPKRTNNLPSYFSSNNEIVDDPIISKLWKSDGCLLIDCTKTNYHRPGMLVDDEISQITEDFHDMDSVAYAESVVTTTTTTDKCRNINNTPSCCGSTKTSKSHGNQDEELLEILNGSFSSLPPQRDYISVKKIPCCDESWSQGKQDDEHNIDHVGGDEDDTSCTSMWEMLSSNFASCPSLNYEQEFNSFPGATTDTNTKKGERSLSEMLENLNRSSRSLPIPHMKATTENRGSIPCHNSSLLDYSTSVPMLIHPSSSRQLSPMMHDVGPKFQQDEDNWLQQDLLDDDEEVSSHKNKQMVVTQHHEKNIQPPRALKPSLHDQCTTSNKKKSPTANHSRQTIRTVARSKKKIREETGSVSFATSTRFENTSGLRLRILEANESIQHDEHMMMATRKISPRISLNDSITLLPHQETPAVETASHCERSIDESYTNQSRSSVCSNERSRRRRRSSSVSVNSNDMQRAIRRQASKKKMLATNSGNNKNINTVDANTSTLSRSIVATTTTTSTRIVEESSSISDANTTCVSSTNVSLPQEEEHGENERRTRQATRSQSRELRQRISRSRSRSRSPRRAAETNNMTAPPHPSQGTISETNKNDEPSTLIRKLDLIRTKSKKSVCSGIVSCESSRATSSISKALSQTRSRTREGNEHRPQSTEKKDTTHSKSDESIVQRTTSWKEARIHHGPKNESVKETRHLRGSSHKSKSTHHRSIPQEDCMIEQKKSHHSSGTKKIRSSEFQLDAGMRIRASALHGQRLDPGIDKKRNQSSCLNTHIASSSTSTSTARPRGVSRSKSLMTVDTAMAVVAQGQHVTRTAAATKQQRPPGVSRSKSVMTVDTTMAVVAAEQQQQHVIRTANTTERPPGVSRSKSHMTTDTTRAIAWDTQPHDEDQRFTTTASNGQSDNKNEIEAFCNSIKRGDFTIINII